MSHPHVTVGSESYEERPRRSAYNGGEMTMVQVAWATLGLLAVAVFGMFGMFFYLGARIDATNQRIDALGTRLDGTNGRIDVLVGELQKLATRLTARIERLERWMGAPEEQE